MIKIFAIILFSPILLWGSENVIVITLDTTRADHVYAHPENAPFLNRIASEGLIFNRCITPVPATLPSHVSMFTGLYPFHTDIRFNLHKALPDSATTLAEILKQNKYQTAAVISSSILHDRFGLSQGFDIYDQDIESGRVERDAGNVTDAGLRILKSLKSPFFLWLHYFDPHYPYQPPSPYDQGYSSDYAGEIAYMDHQIQRFWNNVPEIIRNNTILFISGDHGEGLGDHGEDEHGLLVYQTTLAVPFLVYRSGDRRTGTVDTMVSVTSLTPTILDYLSLDTSSFKFDTPSLKGYIDGSSSDNQWLYFESYLPYLYFNWSPMRGVVNGRWKYTEAPIEELFDLNLDPREQLNLAGKRPKIMDLLKEKMADISPENRNAIDLTEPMKLPGEEMRKLESLGYLQGGSSTRKTSESELRDPKALIELADDILMIAPELLKEKKYDRVVKLMTNALREDRFNIRAMYVLAKALIGMRDYTQAEKVLQRACSLSPGAHYLLSNLGVVFIRQGNIEKAIPPLKEAYTINPYDREVLANFAEALVRSGDFAEAENVFRFSEANNLMDSYVLSARGFMEISKNRFDSALSTFLKVVEMNPEDAMAYANIAYIHEVKNEKEKAIYYYSRAFDLEPQNPSLLKAIIGLQLELRNNKEAVRYMEMYVDRYPNASDIHFVKKQLQLLKSR